MPRSKSAAKHLKTDAKRRVSHKAKKSELKSIEKKFGTILQKKELDSAKKQLEIIFSKLDKSVKSGTIHPNKASRKKSRLAKTLNSSASKS